MASTGDNVLLVERKGLFKAPGSSATVTLFRTTADGFADGSFATTYCRYMLSVYSSHDSGSSGLTFQASVDGTNWRTVETAATYANSNGLSTYDYLIKFPHLLIQYTNSANTLTAWEVALYGIKSRAGS